MVKFVAKNKFLCYANDIRHNNLKNKFMATWANLKRDMRRVAKKKKAKYTPKTMKGAKKK